MEKNIEILGEQIILRFNMAVQLAYEEITGRPFTVQEMTMKKAQMALFIAAIITNNPETGITMDRLLTEAAGDDITKLDTAMGEIISEWYHLPDRVVEVLEEDNEKAAKRARNKKGKDEKQKH